MIETLTRTARKPALLGGIPVGAVTAPHWPGHSARAVERAAQLLRDGVSCGFNRLAPTIAEFEHAAGRYHEGRQVLGVSSGHAALHSAVAGCDVGPGEEVVTTPYTWGASISCILHQGAIPVFADVDPLTGLIDPDTVEALITPRTRAILAVHLYGQPCDLGRLRQIADRHGLALIEDGSQAHGARWNGRPVGCYGDAAGFSCMGGKLLASTEAGYMVAASDGIYRRACMLGQHAARSPEGGFPDELRPYVDSLMYTYRMTPLDAVLLSEALPQLDERHRARAANVARLRARLRDLPILELPRYPEQADPAYHMMTMNLARDAGLARETVFRAVQAEGINAWAYVPSPIPDWKRLHWQDYRGPACSWIASLRASGIDYRDMAIPGCRHKVAHAIELHMNAFYEPAEHSMDRIADAFEKVAESVDALREWERAQPGGKEVR